MQAEESNGDQCSTNGNQVLANSSLFWADGDCGLANGNYGWTKVWAEFKLMVTEF
jgi:hypothetical protein